MAAVNISALQTEGVNPSTAGIDQVSTGELCKLINNEDALVAPAVSKCIPAISGAIDAVAPRISRGGRLFYVGAGTSGRCVAQFFLLLGVSLYIFPCNDWKS